MKPSEFFGKFTTVYLWGNLIAMAGVVLLCIFGVKYGLELYTYHGQSIEVPNLKMKSYEEAERTLRHLGLQVVVTDTGYVKTLPVNCILEQTPKAGERVKKGRVVDLTSNAGRSPMISIPDVIDNSSLREAMAKLTSLGFKLAPPEQVSGEKDWVYGIKANGVNVVTGQKVSVDLPLTILVGNGMRTLTDSVDYVEPERNVDKGFWDEEDDFKEVH